MVPKERMVSTANLELLVLSDLLVMSVLLVQKVPLVMLALVVPRETRETQVLPASKELLANVDPKESKERLDLVDLLVSVDLLDPRVRLVPSEQLGAWV